MFRHLVLFRLGTSDPAGKAEQCAELKRRLESQYGVIDGFEKVLVQPGIGGGDDWDLVMDCVHRSTETMTAYASHPLHGEIVTYLYSVVTHRAAVDWTIDGLPGVPGRYRRFSFWRFPADDAERTRRIGQIVERLPSILAALPELSGLEVDREMGWIESNWDLAAIVSAESPELLAAYRDHPAVAEIEREVAAAGGESAHAEVGPGVPLGGDA